MIPHATNTDNPVDFPKVEDRRSGNDRRAEGRSASFERRRQIYEGEHRVAKTTTV